MINKQTKRMAILMAASAIALTACGSNAANTGQQAENASGQGKQTTGTSNSDQPAADQAGGEAASKGGKTVVTLSVPTNDRFMQQAVQAFEQAHPDIEIKVDAFSAVPADQKNTMIMKNGQMNTEDEATLEKYRTSVNTALMSGKADDIVAVQDLNWGVYADKGLLADLASYEDKDGDFQNGALNKNVLDAVKWNGHSYALPIDYGIQFLMGNQPEIAKSNVTINDRSWTWDQFFKQGQQMVQAGGGQLAILTAESELELFNTILRSSYNQFVDSAAKKASFDSNAFMDLLRTIKDDSDQGLIRNGMDKSSDDLFKAMNVEVPMMLVTIPQMTYGGKGRVYEMPGDGKGGGLAFSPDLMLAVNGKSKVKDAAWAFLQFLVSDQLQTNPALSGFAVRNASLEKSMNDLKAKLADGHLKIQIRRNDGETQQPTISGDDVKNAVHIAEQADTYTYLNPEIIQIAVDEAEAFFKGEKSAEDAAKQIQDRVMTYLNE